MIESLFLYSTSACSLCERAEQLLRSMPELRSVTLNVVDIAQDATLIARYGTSIPVVATGSGNSIAWPFNADAVIELISARGRLDPA